jgi:hypothetical protein
LIPSVSLDDALLAMRQHAPIFNGITNAAQEHVAKNLDERFRKTTRANMMRDFVFAEEMAIANATSGVRIYQKNREHLGVLIVPAGASQLALQFKQIKGLRPSRVVTQRVKRIATQMEVLDFEDMTVEPTWAYAGWTWDTLGRRIVCMHVLCPDGDGWLWRIENDSIQMRGYAQGRLVFEEPSDLVLGAVTPIVPEDSRVEPTGTRAGRVRRRTQNE